MLVLVVGEFIKIIVHFPAAHQRANGPAIMRRKASDGGRGEGSEEAVGGIRTHTQTQSTTSTGATEQENSGRRGEGVRGSSPCSVLINVPGDETR